MLKNKNFFLVLFGLIFTLSLFLRLYMLPDIPAGFHLDEASKGYSGYSILKTGKDDNGNFLPLTIDVFGDNSPAGYHCLTIPFISTLGLNELAVRLPGALFGSLTVISFYFLIYAIFQNKKLGLISCFLLAISPWHINMSRASSESLVALFFIISGFASIIWAVRKQRIKFLVIGTLILSVSFLFYQTPRLFVPLLYFVLLFYLLKTQKLSKNFKSVLISCFIFLVGVVFVLFFIVPGGQGRFTQVNIFNSQDTLLKMNEEIAGEGLLGTSPLVSRAFHNKYISYTQTYISNYLSYFSPNFLFVKDLPFLYQIPGFGVLYLVELPFVMLGIFALLKDKGKFHKIPLIWLVLAPTAAAIAVDTHNLQRALVMFPMFEVLTGVGVLYLVEQFPKKKKVLSFFIAILFALNFIYFFHQYFSLSKVFQPWYRNNEFSKMMETVNKNYDNVDKIIATKSGGGYPLFQFYKKYDPADYQKAGSPKDKSYSGFGKFFFSPDNCPFISLDPKIPKRGKLIYIEDGSCKETEKVKEAKHIYILRPDSTKAFRIVFLGI